MSELQDRFKRYFLYEKGNKAKSYKAVIASLNMLIKDTKEEKIKNITTFLIREFLLKNREEKQWSPKTYRNHWQNLKSFFDWCQKAHLIKKNPVNEIEKPKLNKSLPRCITKEEVKQILFHTEWFKWTYRLEKTRNIAMLSTLILSGLRLQELLNLKVSDVNLESQEIFIKEGKGGKDRIVPIHQQLLPKLQIYFQERQSKLKASQWFFTSIRSDKQLTQKNVQEICKKIQIASHVYFTPHMLRHTFGRLSVDADLNLYKLKTIMGHSQITTTQRYLSVSTESIKRSFCEIQML